MGTTNAAIILAGGLNARATERNQETAQPRHCPSCGATDNAEPIDRWAGRWVKVWACCGAEVESVLHTAPYQWDARCDR